MTETRHYEPHGSWILKIVIVILIVVLIASVLYPQRLWDKQEALIEASRMQMDNINYIEQRYHEVTGIYNADLDSLLRFIELDSIAVNRASFEVEKMSLYDAPYDSFLIDFSDRFHFELIEADAFSGGRPIDESAMDGAVVDSVVLKMMPKDEFAGVVHPVLYKLVSPQDLHYYYPRKGEEDRSIVIWGDGRITRDYLPVEDYKVLSKLYLLTMSPDNLGVDPITGEGYELNLNVRMTFEGKIDFTMVAKGEANPPVAGSELYTNLFVNRLARQARARLDQDLQKDSTLYAHQFEMQSEYFDVELDLMSPKKITTVESNTELVIPVDSVSFYEDTARIRGMLFKVQYDSLVRIWASLPKTQDILAQLTYTERVGVTRYDTVGVRIRPRMGKEFNLPAEGVLDKIFAVGPIRNPGMIENNDLSWSETR